jgi:hypothetical protein
MSLAKRMLVDFLNVAGGISPIDVFDADDGDRRPRLITHGSTGIVERTIDSVPLFANDKYGYERYERTTMMTVACRSFTSNDSSTNRYFDHDSLLSLTSTHCVDVEANVHSIDWRISTSRCVRRDCYDCCSSACVNEQHSM